MLFATYQPFTVEGDYNIPIKETELWCIPVTSVADCFVHSMFAAPNFPAGIFFLESTDFTRVDKIKHYQDIMNGDTTSPIKTNLNAPDKYSEFLVHTVDEWVASLALRPVMHLDGILSLTAPYLTPQMSQNIRKQAQKLLPVLRNASMVCDDPIRIEQEQCKYAFEFLVLPYIVQHVLGQNPGPDDVLMTSFNFWDAMAIYDKFMSWQANACDQKTYSQLYDEMRALVIDNSQVCTALANGKPGRNDACPCGSGKKWKKCHGQMLK